MQRLLIVIALAAVAGCGRIGPGAASRPAATGDPLPDNGNSGSSSGPSRSVFDEKGCANAQGQSGQDAQAACRQGK